MARRLYISLPEDVLRLKAAFRVFASIRVTAAKVDETERKPKRNWPRRVMLVEWMLDRSSLFHGSRGYGSGRRGAAADGPRSKLCVM